MFKLVISLVNHETGATRKLESVRRYKHEIEAHKAAEKMRYVYMNERGNITHECKVRIVENCGGVRMYEVYLTELNTLTGEKKCYGYKQGFKSLGKALKLTRELMDEIDSFRPVADEYEYTIEVAKSKTRKR
ncbi:hypothetical protein VQ366_001213 [Salmonella enterica]|nr:hypothetical protein [Salmonella enterica]EMD3452930.1 hypothetical protein [Salmonella enterica]EMD3479976.1 hypothetical protein [Salmonella enterica]EMD3520052.1 hypothetical protein [Salmonella enterica]EMD3583447.1 hypothetical protein [Salmonella enterica]